jgi:tRNA threonylcarbamoyladenosine biosynthesis protein TsaB
MANILHIETATKNCSVSVATKGQCIALVEENDKQFSHAEKLQRFIIRSLQHAGMGLKDINTIAVSEGPGSYTGLRIGVATAKGLCYALDIPLISISTLEIIARKVKGYQKIIPLLEARKMEVYTAIFDDRYQLLEKPHTKILNSDSFKDYTSVEKVAFIGNAVEKWNELTKGECTTIKTLPSAKEMIAPAFEAYQNQEFVNTAYFEPFYLKDFIAGPSKKAKAR